MNENFNETHMAPYLERIAATFAFGLPEHEQKKRLQAVLKEVFEHGQKNPIIRKNKDGVAVRKGSR